MSGLSIKNNKGQLVIEAVLIMTVAIGLLMAASKIFREKKFLAQVTSKPWEVVDGMVETGVWGERNSVKSKHPNNFIRVSTSIPPQ